MTNENLDTTNKLIKPEDISPSDDEVIRQLSDNLQDITPEDVEAMCDEMDEVEKGKEEEKNYVKVEENTNILGYTGKKIHIYLPAVGNFHGFKFDCFVSDESLKKDVFKQVDIHEKIESFGKDSHSMFDIGKLLKETEESNKKANRLEAQSCSVREVSNLLRAVREFIQEKGIDKDNYRCEDFLNNITGLGGKCYWLFDKKEGGIRAQWNCRDDYSFRWVEYDFYDAKLLLKLHD